MAITRKYTNFCRADESILDVIWNSALSCYDIISDPLCLLRLASEQDRFCSLQHSPSTVGIYDYSPKLLGRDGGPLLLRNVLDKIQDVPPYRGVSEPREGLQEREPVRRGDDIRHMIKSKRVVMLHRRAIE
jgi:hypothetical protein